MPEILTYPDESVPRYTDPTVAYNTGYNDGQREERDVWQKALADLEIELLHDEWATTLSRFCGRLKQLRDKLALR
jgi:hypothetical protein